MTASGTGITGGGSVGTRGSSVRYGTRLGDLKRVGFSCFSIKHSTHTRSDSLNGAEGGGQ